MNEKNNRFKFRVWNKQICEMFDVLKIDYLEEEVVVINERNAFTEYFNDVIFMQCTGLKDKNGKLIYEGDIVKEPFEPLGSDAKRYKYFNLGVVRYYKCHYGVQWIVTERTCHSIPIELIDNPFSQPYRKIDKDEFVSTYDNFFKTEIIGNIYQNPELLEGK